MANNPYVNKVIYDGNTVMDLTGLTIMADKVARGYTTHNSAGNVIIGTAPDAQAIAYVMNARVDLELPSDIARVVGTNLIIDEKE